MEYRKLGTSDLDVSAIGLGTWGIGGEFFGMTDESNAIQALQAGLDHGINLIDTAPVYGRGKSEEIVGKALKGGYRQKCILATKCGFLKHWTQYVRCSDPFFIRDGIEGSLRRLQTDVIDLCQIHYPDEVTPIEVAMEELLKLKKEGKIRYIGVSNFSVAQMSAAKACGEVVSLQPKYSMIDREIDEEILPYCIREDIGVMTFGSLGGGILTGKYKTLPERSPTEKRWSFYKGFSEPGFTQTMKLLETVEQIANETGRPVSDISMNWVTHQKGITTALVGVKNVEQAVANAAAGDIKLTQEQIERMNTAYAEAFAGKEPKIEQIF